MAAVEDDRGVGPEQQEPGTVDVGTLESVGDTVRRNTEAIARLEDRVAALEDQRTREALNDG
jgi:hypothetical protein